jgi:hypothetical protein
VKTRSATRIPGYLHSMDVGWVTGSGPSSCWTHIREERSSDVSLGSDRLPAVVSAMRPVYFVLTSQVQSAVMLAHANRIFTATSTIPSSVFVVYFTTFSQ